MPQNPIDEDSDLFSFEERLVTEIESFVQGIDAKVRDCESISEAARGFESADAERDGRIAELEGMLAAAKRREGAAASADGLTGLSDRQEILRRIKEEKNRADRSIPAGGVGFSVVLFDLDGLSSVNDAFGVQAGDRAIKRFASFLKSSFRSYDAVGRYGSDEFLVLLPGADQDQALRVFREARKRLAAWDGLSKESARPGMSKPALPLTCSAGIASYRSEGKSASKDVNGVIAHAEYALHRARRKGGGEAAAWGGQKGSERG